MLDHPRVHREDPEQSPRTFLAAARLSLTSVLKMDIKSRYLPRRETVPAGLAVAGGFLSCLLPGAGFPVFVYAAWAVSIFFMERAQYEDRGRGLEMALPILTVFALAVLAMNIVSRGVQFLVVLGGNIFAYDPKEILPAVAILSTVVTCVIYISGRHRLICEEEERFKRLTEAIKSKQRAEL